MILLQELQLTTATLLNHTLNKTKMSIENLTSEERVLLSKLNHRAITIVKLENILHAKKVPFDSNLLHDLETSKLEELLENWSDETLTQKIKKIN